MDMKRTIALVLVCFMAFGIFGCVEKVPVTEKDQAVADAVAKTAAEEQMKAEEAVQKKSDELSKQLKALEEERKSSEELANQLTKKVDGLEEVIKELQEEEEIIEQETESREDLEDVDVELGDNLGDKTYDDGDINRLFDGEVRFDGDDYDVFEEIRTTTSLKPLYSLTGDEEFGSVPYLGTVDKDSIEYRFVFEDTIDVDDIDRDEPLEITFLGESLVITDIDDSGKDFEVRAGETLWLAVNEVVDVFDVTLKLVGVTEDGDSAGIAVNGNLDWLDEGDSEEYDGISISVERVLAVNSQNGGNAKLVITDTEDVYRNFDNGDSIVYDEKDKDAEWVYTLGVSAGELEYIGIAHNQKIDELDDDFEPQGLGGGFCLPNEYVCIMFDSTNVDEYNLITMEFDDVEDEAGNDFDGLIFLSEDEEGFEIDGEETDEIYAWYDSGNWELAYLDDESEVIDASDDQFDVVFEDTTYTVDYNGYVRIDFIELDVTVVGGEFKYLGSEEEDAESGDILYNGIAIGNREYDVLGFDGVIILEPEDNADNDFVEILVPEDKLELTFTLG